MNRQQADIMRHGKGFVAALDQSGGSTPQALERYGILKDSYSGQEEMFELVHQMRTRIVTSPAFTSERILGAILFEQTMDRTVEGFFTGDYLWEEKGIVPFLKVDQGLDAFNHGVQLMKPMTNLDNLLKKALERKIFGTKMRSVIKTADVSGIERAVRQQFEYALQIAGYGLMPIVEPEVDINNPDKAASEAILKEQLLKQLDILPASVSVMLKLSIPSADGFYSDLIAHPRVLRVLALSGGYSQKEANRLLARNPGLIASFSRALAEGLSAGQTDDVFNAVLSQSVDSIYKASIT